MTIADMVMWSMVAALGGVPSEGSLSSGQVHGAPMATLAQAKVGVAPDAGTAAAKPPAAPVAVPASPAASAVSTPDAGTQASPAAPAMAADVKVLVDRMQAFYEQTQDFTARFQQDYSYQAFKRKQTSTGTVSFKKPGLMRWEYLKPSPRTFVVSNDRLYMHDPAAMTLTKGTFDSSQLSASVTFLWGRGKLADEFSIQKIACKDCKGTLLELTPKKADPRFKLIRLEVDPKTAQVLRSIVIDPDGSQNAITFMDMKTNTGLKDDAFVLAPPANTQVVDMTRGQK